jgi:hypothetical protein
VMIWAMTRSSENTAPVTSSMVVEEPTTQQSAYPATSVPATASTSAPQPAPTTPAISDPQLQPTEVTEVAASSPATDPVAEPVAETAPEPTVAEPVKVRIRVETAPRIAKLMLDGTSVANPYDVLVDQSGIHKFEASAEGHVSVVREVQYDKSQIVLLSLPKVKRPTKPTIKKSRPVRRATPRRASTPPSRSVKPARSAARPPQSAKKRPRRKPRGAGFTTENPY